MKIDCIPCLVPISPNERIGGKTTSQPIWTKRLFPTSTSPPPWPAFLSTGLWPVFYPVAVECACIIYLTLLKAYFERFPADGARMYPDAAGESTSINGIKPVGGARRSPKMGKYGAAGYVPASSPEVAPKV